MGILTKQQIISHIEKGQLLLNAHRKENGEYDVEPASYDFHAGTFIFKITDPNTGKSETISKFYKPELPAEKQDTITLQPGQVIFVITYEEVKLPKNICGTVYAKNCFSREGILALTTGHVDPGIQCPIVIRLINLRSIPRTFRLGEPIYTIVFQKLDVENQIHLIAHENISMEKTYEKTLESVNAALGNTLYDLSLTNDFVKKEEFGKMLRVVLLKNIYKIIAWHIAFLVALITIISGWPSLKESIKWIFK